MLSYYVNFFFCVLFLSYIFLNLNSLILFSKMFIFDLYLFLNYNIYLYLLFFILLYLKYILEINKKKFYIKINKFNKVNYLFYNKYNKFYIYLSINIVMLLFFILFYFNMFYNNIYNYIFISSNLKLNFIKFNFDFNVSFDYVNIYFIILTIFIFTIIYFALFSVKYKGDLSRKKNFMFINIFFFTEILILLTFCTSNVFFFFFFFECSLIPMYVLITLSGKGFKKKHFAALSLVFYTLFGSIFLLLAIIYLISLNKLDFKSLNFELLDFDSQIFLFICFLIGFSVKVPIFPFYSWLPEAHVEASTSVSILLASIFLKIATYGLLKIVVFNFNLINYFFYSVIFYFSVVSIFAASILTLIQTDLKKIIALSSVIHMNYIIISLFSLDSKMILASLIYMFSHAFVSSGLFYLIGLLYESTGTRDLLNLSGSIRYNSKFFFFFVVYNLANISFPLSVSFVSEIMLLNNLTFVNIFILILFLISLFFSTLYTFWLIHNIFFGKQFNKKNFFHLNKFDFYFLNVLLFIIIVLGFIPSLVLYNLEQEIYLILINKLNVY